MSESKIVPKEPTYEMVQAGALVVKNNLPYHTGTLEIYKAMLDAAPSADQGELVESHKNMRIDHVQLIKLFSMVLSSSHHMLDDSEELHDEVMLIEKAQWEPLHKALEAISEQLPPRPGYVESSITNGVYALECALQSAEAARKDAARYQRVKPVLSGDDGKLADKIALEIAAGLMRGEPLDVIVDGLIAADAAIAGK